MDEKMKDPSEAKNSITEEKGDIVSFRRDTLERGFKSRHAQMIALGGTIGTALFVESGQSLHMYGGGTVF